MVFFQRESKAPFKLALPEQYSQIVAVDGGLNDVQNLGLIADVFVGDCDSVEVDFSTLKSCAIYPKDKDYLDGEGALEYVQQQNFDKITFYSFFQGRWDMTFTHFLSLTQYPKFANKLEIICENSKILYFNKSFILKGKIGQKFSIIPLAEINSISITGAKYNLDSETVKLGRGSCLSNLFEESHIEITLIEQSPLLIELHSS